MTLQDCYQALGGDYDDVMGRLRKESMVEKFVFRFLEDQSFSVLCSAIQEKNREEAFRAAHTIKGVCQNLGFTKLLESSSDLTEALRTQWEESVPSLFERVTADYNQAAAAITAYRNQTENM